MSTKSREPWLIEAGQRFITIRRSRDLSQRELSRISGVARQTIQRLENGTAFPTPTTRVKLEAALGVESLGRVLLEER